MINTYKPIFVRIDRKKKKKKQVMRNANYTINLILSYKYNIEKYKNNI